MPTPSSRPTNVRWLIAALLTGIVFLAHFNRVSISVAGTERFIGPGGLTQEQMGLVYSAFLLVYTLGMLPGGWLIDRFGPRLALAALGVGFGACAALTGALGFAGLTVAAMWLPLVLIRGLAGATSVPLHPAAARAVSLWFPLGERSTANGLVTAGALVGIALTYPVFGRLMDRLDWPGAFAVSGAALFAFGLVWLALSADHPADHPWANDAERGLAAGTGTPPRTAATPRECLGLFRNRSLVLLTLSYGAVGYVQYMFFYWVQFYFSDVLKLSKGESRDGAFVVSMAMAVGMLCGGWLTDRLCRWLGHRRGARTMVLAGMGSAVGFSLLGLAAPDPRLVVGCFAAALAVLGLCEGVFWTTAPTLAPRAGGLACAVVNTGGNGVGMLAPVVTPWLAATFDWSAPVIAASVVCGTGAVLWLGIDPEAGGVEQPEVHDIEV
jgi:MFS family permease